MSNDRFDGIRNECTGMIVYWLVPLTVDYPGSRRCIVRGHSGADGPLFCGVASFDPAGAFSSLNSEYFPANTNDAVVAVSFRASVPAGGTVSLYCSMPAGSVLHSVDYAP